MKIVNVSAAAIVQDNKVLATRRGYGAYKDWWEFPGGKLEDGESPEDALIREIREELNVEISVGKLLRTVEYDYPGFHLVMHCFLCSIRSGVLTLNEHEDARWLSVSELGSVAWLPADLLLLEDLQKCL